MKTTAQVREKEISIYKLLWSNAKSQLLAAHPETGGNEMLAHNWGNEACQVILDQKRDREHKLFLMFRCAYDKAFITEYPNHSYSLKLINP